MISVPFSKDELSYDFGRVVLYLLPACINNTEHYSTVILKTSWSNGLINGLMVKC